MDSIHTILIKKAGSNTVYNSFSSFDIVCLNFPFKTFGETKEPYSVDWKDENGTDVYLGSTLFIKPYDIKVEFGYVGQSVMSGTPNLHKAYQAIVAFQKFLTGYDGTPGTGTDLTIYSPFTGMGRQHIYVVNTGDEKPRFIAKQQGNNLYNENVLTFSMTFRVCDPIIQVTLSESVS